MDDWSNLCTTSDSSIGEVIRIISEGRCQIAMVTSSDRKLVGTITDGDIRRGLMKGLTMEDSAGKIMNTGFTAVGPDEEKTAVLTKMRKRSIHQVPVVDESGEIQGLYLLDELINPKRRSNPVLLMAGGLGSRLRPLTDNTPKPMLKVGNKPVLETILDGFIEQGFENFYISVNYLAHVIQDYFQDGRSWGVNIEYLVENKRLGTGGALGLLPSDIRSPVLVMNGDVLTRVDYGGFLAFHNEQNAIATMSVRPYQVTVPYGVVETESGIVTRFREKPVFQHNVNAGIYVVDPALISYLNPEQSMDMPQLLESARSDGKRVSAFPIHEYWLDVGHHEELDRAEREYDTSFNSDDVRSLK